MERSEMDALKSGQLGEAPRIYPTLRCQDAHRMLEWLTETLTFNRGYTVEADGVIQHAELSFGPSVIMIGQDRPDDYGKRVGDFSGRRTDALYVAVDEPEPLLERLAAAGIPIEVALHTTDYGSRDFACRDPEGNLWHFGTYRPAGSTTFAEPERS